MKTDNDTYYVFGNKVSRKEIEHLENISGKTTLSGDLIRLHDACAEFKRVFLEALRPLVPRRWR